ncbi:MAG: PEP-CTERM sorting domain-containing protein [Sedimentisphaerales bacterium]|nr:PEP-CTERM sorting domain-containing protein [Sedimentisphaerales bacterium]
MNTKLCILIMVLALGTTPAFAAIYTLNPVDVSLPRVNDAGDGISQIGVDQAWFAFDLSSIPDSESIVSATFSAYMRDFDGSSSQRTLWYSSDDSWIVTTTPNMSDPGNASADNIVGTVYFNDQPYTWITINITHDWTNDISDDYVTLMLTGPTSTFYAGGAVGIKTLESDGIFADPELSIVTVPAPGAILLGSLGVGIVGWMRRRRTL